MLTSLVIAAALAAGVHWAAVALAAGMLVSPPATFVVLAGWVIAGRIRGRRRSSGPDEEATFLRGLAAELRSGAALRAALGAAAARAPGLDLTRVVRLAAVGATADDVSAALLEELPHTGRITAPAFRLAATTGAAAARVFDAVAVRAAEIAEQRREARALSAQARLSALVVGFAPLVFGVLLLLSGRGSSIAAAGAAGWSMMGTGLLLEAAGAVVVTLMMRKALR